MPQDGNRRHYRPLPHQPSQRRCASGDFTFEEQELFRLAVGHQQVPRANGRILIRRHIYDSQPHPIGTFQPLASLRSDHDGLPTMRWFDIDKNRRANREDE